MQEYGEIMSYREQIAVEIYEKNFSLENLNWMYQEGRLHFPHPKKASKYQDTVAHLIDAIQIGIPMPVIYVSELQNGDFLILESKEWLLALLVYLQGTFYVHVDEMPPNLKKCFFHELSQELPKLASMILRANFFFRIIDYHTPRYLHMETALFHEKWSVGQEQNIRNILYKEHGIEALNHISKEIRSLINNAPSQKSFLKDYEILYMLLFWGIYNRLLPLDAQDNYGEHELLEITILNLHKNYYRWKSFLNIIDDITAFYIDQLNFMKKPEYLSASYYKNRKAKAKAYGLALCVFDMCRRKGSDPFFAFDRFFYVYMHEIEVLPVTLSGIRSYLTYLWEEFI